MGAMSLWHWIIVIAIVLILFGGRGKISDIMGDFAKGIKSFKKGMAEDDTSETTVETVDSEPAKVIEHQTEAEPKISKPRSKAASKSPTKTTAAKSTAARKKASS